MVPENKQRALAELYLPIEDEQERLMLLLDRARKRSPLPDAQKTDAHRVQGCTSRVWLVSRLEEGRCRFDIDADSSLVRGLASAICEIYDGAAPADVEAFEPHLLETLDLAENLSPTRRHGLQQVRSAIREFAQAARQLPPAG